MYSFMILGELDGREHDLPGENMLCYLFLL